MSASIENTMIPHCAGTGLCDLDFFTGWQIIALWMM
jgi:hypothetical protein